MRTLVYYKVCYWWFYGMVDFNGRMLLDSLNNSGSGVCVKSGEVRTVHGEELVRQVAAIEYFEAKEN